MTDLRWSDCDELAASDPIACLLCRTGKLNDHAHSTDIKLATLERHINWFGVVTTALGLISTGIGLWRSLHGA